MTGQWDYIRGKVDVEQILRQCSEKFTKEEVEKFYIHLPNLVNLMIDQGELYESDFECPGYPKLESKGKSRDDLVLNRRRFVFLTNPSLLRREEEKRLKKIAVAEEKVVNCEKRKVAAVEKKNAEKKNNPPPKKGRLQEGNKKL